MSDTCTDNRFKIIAEAKKDLLESTNIEMAPDEMAVLDSFLLRCWQMGWLKQYETYTFYIDKDNSYKEHNQEDHVWTKVLRQLEEMKATDEEYLEYSKVIHCKDCKFYTPMNRILKTGICSMTMHHLGDDGFCSTAERRKPKVRKN